MEVCRRRSILVFGRVLIILSLSQDATSTAGVFSATQAMRLCATAELHGSQVDREKSVGGLL